MLTLLGLALFWTFIEETCLLHFKNENEICGRTDFKVDHSLTAATLCVLLLRLTI